MSADPHRVLASVERRFELRAIFQDPTVDGRMVDGHPAFLHEFFHLVVAQGELSQPFRLAYVFTLASMLISMLHYSLREGEAVQERAEAVIALSTEYGFPLLGAGGTILRSWVLAVHAQEEAGIAQMHQALAPDRRQD
jgi:hypothetical protein